MSDIIRLLPDTIANQIAAGEVVQRPASAVKELLENAIDAGATVIQLIIKDGGKGLLQVIDDGKGMSETDARLAFERHATSKISNAEDLFRISTKGFRGEALASIAAVAQVELKTRRETDELGTRIIIEGSEIKLQEVCQCAKGSSFAVRNLFYNTPARRHFLKSDSIEYKHIIDEFERVALAHPAITFKMSNDGAEVFNLPATSLRQRIVAVFGAKYNERLVPVDVHTDQASITGFVGKPDFARKTRGEQFFFVNDRYIKSGFFNHAVMQSFENLLPSGSYPLYMLYIQVDPSTIDVNIHPTKTEVKFRDERLVYAFIMSGIRQALGKHHLTPSIDFDVESSLNLMDMPKNAPVKIPTIDINPDYNPFNTSAEGNRHDTRGSGFNLSQRFGPDKIPANWRDVYEISQQQSRETATQEQLLNSAGAFEEVKSPVFAFNARFLVSRMKGKLLLIDARRAMERIKYEEFMRMLQHHSGSSQQLLFPETLSLNTADAAILGPLLPELEKLGLEIEAFGPREFIIRGVPAESPAESGVQLLEQFLEQYKNGSSEFRSKPVERLALSLARSAATNAAESGNNEEMQALIGRLFACAQPMLDPLGRPVIITLSAEEIKDKFD
jgi:DNA mismatch repair protein MutL